MSFLDLHGGLGRRFAGIGVTLAEIQTRLECTRSAEFSAEGPDAERAVKYARLLLDMSGCTEAVRIRVHEAIPRHAGLGSGTQMALAVGTAIRHLFDLDLSLHEIASKLGRGARSGIGIGAFEQGGFLVDGGRGAGDLLPRIIARHPYPEHWRIVLLLARDDAQGLSGSAERRAFSRLPEFSEAEAAKLCRLTLMKLLPSLLESDLCGFAEGIGALQRRIGEYFAPVQGGGRFLRPGIARLLEQAEQLGFPGVGQSSWGPTGFILTDSETQAHSLVRKLQPTDPDVEIRIVSVANRGHQRTEGASIEAAASLHQAS